MASPSLSGPLTLGGINKSLVPYFLTAPCDIRDVLFPFLTLFTLLALFTARTSTVLRPVVNVSSQYSWMCPLIY